jgi:hypothetical protein
MICSRQGLDWRLDLGTTGLGIPDSSASSTARKTRISANPSLRNFLYAQPQAQSPLVKSSQLRPPHNEPFVHRDVPENRFADSYVYISPAKNGEVVCPTTNLPGKIDLLMKSTISFDAGRIADAYFWQLTKVPRRF